MKRNPLEGWRFSTQQSKSEKCFYSVEKFWRMNVNSDNQPQKEYIIKNNSIPDDRIIYF